MPSNKIVLKTIAGKQYTIDFTYYYTSTSSDVLDAIRYTQTTCTGDNWSIYDDWNEWVTNGIVPTNKEEKNKSCYHDWKEYIGFTEKYWYCEKCDAKSEENPNKCF